MRTACLLFVATIAAASARADVLWAIQDGNLYRVRTASRTAELIGPTGVGRIGGIALTPDGALYGTDTDRDDLIIIDTSTGTASTIGHTGFSIGFTSGIAYDSTNDSIYGSCSGRHLASRLIQIDPFSGDGTNIADTVAWGIAGLDFDASGQLWGVDSETGRDELFRIDELTGELSIVAPQGLSEFKNIGALAIDPSGRFWSIDNRYEDGQELVLIDPVTGTGRAMGIISGFVDGKVVTGLTSVPAPSPLVVLALGALVTRRSRASQSRDR